MDDERASSVARLRFRNSRIAALVVGLPRVLLAGNRSTLCSSVLTAVTVAEDMSVTVASLRA
jgi:hypothetical protein